MKRKRKSPRRHTVKSHIRAGYRVSNYVRGKGTRTIPTLTRRKLIKTDKPKAYTINFRYSEKKGDGESVIVIAQNYKRALAEGFEEKADLREPIEVEVIHPSIGKMLRIVGREAGKIAKLGVKYSYKGVKVLGREALHAVAESYRELRLRRLIDECYSTDRVTQLRARARLKERYPSIYAIADFSRVRQAWPREEWVKTAKRRIH